VLICCNDCLCRTVKVRKFSEQAQHSFDWILNLQLFWTEVASSLILFSMYLSTFFVQLFCVAVFYE